MNLSTIMRDWKKAKETKESKGALEALESVHAENLEDMAKAQAVGGLLKDLETEVERARLKFGRLRSAESLEALTSAQSKLAQRPQIQQAGADALIEAYESCYRRSCSALRDHLPAMISAIEKAIVERETMEQSEAQAGVPYRESGGLMLLKKGRKNLESRLDTVQNREVLENPSMMQWSSMDQWLQKTIGLNPRQEAAA